MYQFIWGFTLKLDVMKYLNTSTKFLKVLLKTMSDAWINVDR